MKFNGLTNEGKAYLAKIKTNHGTIEFKSMKFGDGSLLSYENPETFKKLKNQKSEKEILDKISNRDTITLNAVVDNTALRNGYYLREIGIFVSDQGREILFFYMNDGDETSFVPPETDGPYQAEIGINLVISNVESIVVNNETSDLYVTKAFVERKLKEKQDVIVWKSGGNLEKTNEYKKNDSSFLLDTKGSNQLYEDLLRIINSLDKCPYRIGDIYITTNSQNPALIWIGTTWEKIEGRFLRATANGESARITGGSDSKVLSIDNMPSHNHELTIYEDGSHTHTQSAHSHNRGNMEISGHFEGNRDGAKASGAFKHDGSWNYGSGDGGAAAGINFNASKAWSGNTSTAQPAITSAGNHTHNHRLYYTGGGKSFDIKPAYMTAHQWIRRS
ncbi:phage baseplate protein [Fusobacterium necrophorum]|uniref:phage baseplate protein n=1 Tax=Fusobacterium necrophorum TaxID=859 RepID=UPI00370F7329